MLKKISKIIPMLRLRSRYPNVLYYGAPWFLKFFRIAQRPLKKGYFSQLGQDELIFTEFFEALNSAAFQKVFIDIGCNDPKVHSNSYFFELKQGYSVLAIDALAEVKSMWQQQRPHAKFVQCAVGEAAGELEFDVVAGDTVDSMFSSVSGASQKTVQSKITTKTVEVRRLSDILAENGISRAGIVSMDIEGYEYQALQGIDFDVFSAYFFIIENNAEKGLGSNAIRDLMIRHGYIYFGRIWNLDDIFVHPDALKLH